jgi:hypothetical protein
MKLIKVDNIYTLMDDDKMIASSDSDFQTDYEIKKLSKENCDEIFKVVNIETLSDEYSHDSIWFNKRGTYNNQEFFEYIAKKSFTDGFNKAMELQKDKLFTVEDVKHAMNRVWSWMSIEEEDEDCDLLNELENKVIQSLQQLTEIEVEICCYIGNGDTESDSFKDPLVTNTGIPKLDENGCIVLRKL